MRLNEKTTVFIFLKKSILKYSEVVSDKTKCNTPLYYRRSKHFQALKINSEEKLIVALKPGEMKIQYYVTNDELFGIL